MALIHSFESEGSWLFRYRGQMPLLLFILAVPAVYYTSYDNISDEKIRLINYLSVFLSALGFLIRAYTIGTTPSGTSGRNTTSQVAEHLNTRGIYAIVRHPLYLGNYLMWIGIVLFTKSISFTIIVSLLYWLYYERIMFAEERFLERKYGNVFLEWSKNVPAFFPDFRLFKKSNIPFSIKSVLRREYSGLLATVTGFVFVEFLIGWKKWEAFAVGNTMIYLFACTLAVTMILRTLKHNTAVLNEKDRS
jgi:protein-S-isoprenylcysteine O-methyltransferase Ste14